MKKTKNSYLSIDLDFWMDRANAKSASFFFKKVFKLDVPITCVIEHEELLSDVKKVKNLKTLYNVDYHSDICSDCERDDEPCDGTWVNFVPGRTNANYIWILPSLETYYEEEGICHVEKDPFQDPKASKWKSVNFTDSMKDIEWDKIQRVGVCLSPLFVRLKSIKPILKKLNINVEQAEALITKQPGDQSKRSRGVLSTIKG
jgi:hypothetical protein